MPRPRKSKTRWTLASMYLLITLVLLVILLLLIPNDIFVSFSYLILILSIRWLLVNRIQEIQYSVALGIWKENVLFESKKNGESLRERKERMKKLYDDYVKRSSAEIQRRYAFYLIVVPYVIIIFVVYTMTSIVLTDYVTNDNFLYSLGMKWFLPIIILSISDIIGLFIPRVLQITCMNSSSITEVNFFFTILILSSVGLGITPPLFLSVIISYSYSLVLVISLIPIILGLWGASPWKLAERLTTEIQTSSRELSTCISVLVLLEEAFDQTYDSFKKTFDGVEEESESDMVDDLKNSIVDVINKGKLLISGKIQDAKIRRDIVGTLISLDEYSTIELEDWCVKQYLDEAEKKGRNTIQMKLAYAFGNTNYLNWLVVNSPEFFKNNSKVVLNTLQPLVNENCPENSSDELISILTHIAYSLLLKEIERGHIRLGNIISEVGTWAKPANECCHFIEFAESFNIEENISSKKQFNAGKIAKSILTLPRMQTDWEFLSEIYSMTFKSGLDVNLVGAIYSLLHRIDISWSEMTTNFLTTKPQEDEILILCHRVLSGLSKKEADIVIAGILSYFLHNIEVSTTDIESLFQIGIDCFRFVEDIDSIFNRTFKVNESLYDLESKQDYIKQLLDLQRKDSLLLTLSLYGFSRYGLDFGFILAQVVAQIDEPRSWKKGNELATELYSILNVDEKVQFASWIFISLTDNLSHLQIEDIRSHLSTFLTCVSNVAISSFENSGEESVLFHFRWVFTGILNSLGIFTKFSSENWLDFAKNMDKIGLKFLQTVFLGIGEEDAAASLAFALSTNYPNVSSLSSKLSSSGLLENSMVITILRFWRTIISDSTAVDKTTTDFLLQGKLTPLNQNDFVESAICTILNAAAKCFTSAFGALDTNEEQEKTRDDLPGLFKLMKSKDKEISDRLAFLSMLLSLVTRTIAFLANYRLIRINDPNTLEFNDVTNLISWSHLDFGNESTNSVRLHNAIHSILETSCVGGQEENYRTFLLAVVTNSIYQFGLKDLDIHTRENLKENDEALRYSAIFVDFYRRGGDVLSIAYDSMREELDKRMHRVETEEIYKEPEEDEINRLRIEVGKGPGWVDRLRLLTETEEKEAELRALIRERTERLEQVEDERIRLGKLARKAVQSRIKDPLILEYVSLQTYNYFIITWHKDPIKGTGFGAIINDWLKKNQEELGYPFTLSQGARIGKIPEGLTFQGFKEKAAKEITELCSAKGIKPRMYVISWSPSPFSAHAISDLESLKMNPINALLKVYGEASQDRGKEIEKFVEQSVAGQLSMMKAIQAMNQNYTSLLQLWNSNPLSMLDLVDLTPDEDRILSNYQEEINKLIDSMKNTVGSLTDLVVGENYRSIINDYDELVFSSNTRRSTRRGVKNIVILILDALQCLLSVKL